MIDIGIWSRLGRSLTHRVPVTGADRLQSVGASRVARARGTADDGCPTFTGNILLLQMALLQEGKSRLSRVNFAPHHTKNAPRGRGFLSNYKNGLIFEHPYLGRITAESLARIAVSEVPAKESTLEQKYIRYVVIDIHIAKNFIGKKWKKST